MSDTQGLFRVGPKQQGKTFRVFRVDAVTQRSLSTGAPYRLVKAAIARYGASEVRRVSLGDWLPEQFTKRECESLVQDS
jgi:hypothetical protein